MGQKNLLARTCFTVGKNLLYMAFIMPTDLKFSVF